MLHAHLVEPPPRLTDSRPDLPHAIDYVLAKALAKQKEDRYATGADLVKALRDVALGTSTESLVPVTARAGAETVLARPETPVQLSSPAPLEPARDPASAVAPAVAVAAAAPAVAQDAPPTQSRPPRTITLATGRLVALGAGTVALIAMAVALAVALTGGGNGVAAQSVTT